MQNLCVSEGRKGPKERLSQHIFMILHVHREGYSAFFLFLNSGRYLWWCSPLLMSVGSVDASVTNTIPADPLLTLDESHWLEPKDPGDAVPVAFSLLALPWSTCRGGQDGTTPVPKAWDWCKETQLGVGMTTVACCCHQLDVQYSWDCCECCSFFHCCECCSFPHLSALPISLPFLSYPFPPKWQSQRFIFAL